jgi:Zn-dependent metalloprotease
MILGLIVACSLISAVIVLGIQINSQNTYIVAPDKTDVSAMQWHPGSLTLDTELPKSPASVSVYKIKSIDLIQDGNAEQVMTVGDSIPSASEAPSLAENALEKYGGLPKNAQLVDAVPRYQFKYNLTTETVEEQYPWQTQVRYIQVLNGSPVIGATINLGIGDDGEITSIVKAWPEYDYAGEVGVISAEKAYEKLKNHETTDKIQGDLPEGTKITEIKLGYKLYDEWNSGVKEPYVKPVWIYYAITPLDPEPFPLMVDATA